VDCLPESVKTRQIGVKVNCGLDGRDLPTGAGSTWMVFCDGAGWVPTTSQCWLKTELINHTQGALSTAQCHLIDQPHLGANIW